MSPASTSAHAREASHHPCGSSATPPPAQLLGVSKALSSVRDQLLRYARHRPPVLLRGESGTGKEVAATLLHQRSGRAGELVAINCGATSTTLVQSQLFGHARGAFTGAVSGHRGAFARADKGTLFLDEIGELPLPAQAMLLRVLETRRFCPVGSEVELTTSARLVCATHRDLESMVREGTFRADLYHRLCVLTVTMPALRHRPEDIEPLLLHFATSAAAEVGHPVRFSSTCLRRARGYRWPGNVRELKNAVVRAAVLSEGLAPIDPDTLVGSPTAATVDMLRIPRGDYRSMRRALLESVVADAGSIRRAAAALDVPRSTLGNWLRSG